MTAAPGCAVIKLGGSLAAGAHLPRWANAIAALHSPVVIVPGGGSFADAVRKAQAQIGFSDRAAHAMALLAMAQYGLALCSFHDRFEPAESLDDFREAWVARRIPVWLPAAMAGGRDEIPQNWDMTSDSLAAWLAAQTKARALVMVKSAAPGAAETTAQEMADNGAADPLFPKFFAASGAAGWWLGPQDWPLLAGCIGGSPGGARIV